MRAGLTTLEATDILNVSHPYLVKLLTKGHIPCAMVGSTRRVRLRGLLAYKRRQDERSRVALEK